MLSSTKNNDKNIPPSIFQSPCKLSNEQKILVNNEMINENNYETLIAVYKQKNKYF